MDRRAGGTQVTEQQWWRRNGRRLPRMACGHLGAIQKRDTPRGVEEYAYCAHCGCTEVER